MIRGLQLHKICAKDSTKCNMWIHDIAVPLTYCPADIMFVLDESGSVTGPNFNLMKSFVSALVATLDINSGNTRVGAVSYSSSIDIAGAFNLNAHATVAAVQAAVAAIAYSTGQTYTHFVLEYVRTTMLTAAAGDRPDVPNAVVVMTDGASNYPTATQVCTVWKLTKNFLIVSFIFCPMLPCSALDRLSVQCTAWQHWTEYKITCVSGVRSPATVDKTVTSFMDRSSPNLEHSFYVYGALINISLRPTIVAMATKIWEF